MLNHGLRNYKYFTSHSNLLEINAFVKYQIAALEEDENDLFIMSVISLQIRAFILFPFYPSVFLFCRGNCPTRELIYEVC